MVEARAAWLRPVIVPVAWRYSVAIVLWLGDLAARVRAVREPLELDKPADKYVNIAFNALTLLDTLMLLNALMLNI